MNSRVSSLTSEWIDWIVARATSTDTVVQLSLVAVSLVAALILARPFRAVLDHALADLRQSPGLDRAGNLFRLLILPGLWLALLGGASVGAVDLGYGDEITRDAASLLGAWIIIRISSSLISEPFWSHTVAIAAWTLAALNILNLLAPTLSFLDGLAIEIGESAVSLLSIMQAVFLVCVLLYAALAISTLVRHRIERVPNLTPSIRVLLAQLTRATLIVTAFVISLSSVGIDLSAFAVVGGAIGVGLGFGLQKVVSNLISGVILLLDRSIKPGDVIEVGETFGSVNSLGARYTSVVTRDGKEWLIPNEDLITQRVTNWSYSHTRVRQRVAVGISYDSDLDLATRLILEAAHESGRILGEPEPTCLLIGFGDNSVDLELRYWLDDPEDGVSNVTDAVLRKIWSKFKQHDIEIPFPQRDLHIRSGTLKVQADQSP